MILLSGMIDGKSALFLVLIVFGAFCFSRALRVPVKQGVVWSIVLPGPYPYWSLLPSLGLANPVLPILSVVCVLVALKAMSVLAHKVAPITPVEYNGVRRWLFAAGLCFALWGFIGPLSGH